MNFILIMGLIWMGYGLLSVLFEDDPNWMDYGWLIFAGIYLIVYVFQKTQKYLAIDNGFLKIQGPFGKKINLNDVREIRKFAGDYILKTGNTQLTINTQLIDEESLTELNSILQKLEVEWS